MNAAAPQVMPAIPGDGNAIDPTRCPLCGAPNECQLAAGVSSNAQCWCAAKRFPRELLDRVPEHAQRRACICERCWSEAVRRW
ncbi:MAG TPA: cysteine-rich CWC family protein [Candidatus Paceibacterota bacterium]|nr:cysteine-rich CWC family protein [Verrucomicrobiota bacterium]HSA09097.1 cysteine-rich CWC family protein [Candidatus Paceibacterota bacterium]